MSKIYAKLPKAQKVEAIEKAMDFISSMVETRPDGDTYICLFAQLELELEGLKANDDIKARIRKRREARSTPLAA